MSWIRVHPTLLNTVLLETNPDSPARVAEALSQRLSSFFGETRSKYHQIEWLKGFGEGRVVANTGHCPRIHLTTGAFDVAAVYLSPRFETGALQAEGLMAAGQHLSVGLLPTAQSFELGPESDFNHRFLEAYRRDSTAEPASADLFLGVTKIKLNPFLTWVPGSGSGRDPKVQDYRRRLLHAVKSIWMAVEAWERSAAGERTAALGFTFGWNELLVVAHSGHPADLVELSIALRQGYEMLADGKEHRAHVALTSITVVGHDSRLVRPALAGFDGRFPIGSSPETIAADLVKTAKKFGDPFSQLTAPSGLEVYYELGCHTYPGHEKALLQLFDALGEQLVGLGIPRESVGRPRIEVGKRDLWSSRIPAHETLSPVAASILLCLLRQTVRDGAADGEAGHHRVPHAFDFFTRHGVLERAGGEPGLYSDVPADHVRGLPRDSSPLMLRPDPAQDGLYKSLDSRMRESLRLLQVPYYLTEQIFHLFTTFFWAQDREVLWDESIEMLPFIAAMTRYFEARAAWWEAGCPVSLAGLVGRRPHHPGEKRQWAVRDALEHSFDPELMQALSAYRGFFYNRHLSNYLTDGTPDFNLRYRGSVQGLLSVTHMLLDSLVAGLLGPERACIAVIGDAASPEIRNACSVIVVRLNPEAFTVPIVLESLAHEVGHELVRELLQEGREPDWRQHNGIAPWRDERGRTYRELRDQLEAINEEFFYGGLLPEKDDASRRFVESAGDFVERWVVGYDDLWQWVRSFMLRSVLVALPVTRSLERPEVPRDGAEQEPKKGDVPCPDEKIVQSAVIRAGLVVLTETLAEEPDDWQDAGWIALERLRTTLHETAILGTSGDLVERVASRQAWEDFVNRYILSQPWLRSSPGRLRTAKLFRQLKEFCSGASGGGEESETEAWHAVISLEIRRAFEGYRKVLLEGLVPSLHIRSWANREQRRAAREKILAPPKPWRVTVQPAAYRPADDQPPPKARSILFQRGRIVPWDQEMAEEWARTERDLWLDLLSLVPAWRRRLLRKARRMVVPLEGKR